MIAGTPNKRSEMRIVRRLRHFSRVDERHDQSDDAMATKAGFPCPRAMQASDEDMETAARTLTRTTKCGVHVPRSPHQQSRASNPAGSRDVNDRFISAV